ncbi:class A beta-lactamase-related serine hydrolase [Ureibacillus chungkukjangi]|uniref:serine hydrolase n=1 Tax=Ureibacillus chungkukjangi TaxID=1202712 RepID=UPI00384B6557
MEKNLQDLIEQVPYKVKLVVKDCAEPNQFLFTKDIDDVFSSASLIKVPILVAVLEFLENKNESIHQIVKIAEENRVDFSVLSELEVSEASLYELLVWMIITSDNTATNVLIDFWGMENLNHYFKKIGLKNTTIQRKMMDFEQLEKGFDNLTTAREMAFLFEAIYRQDLLSKKSSELASDILSRQRIQDSLKRYIADDVKVAHKTGSLETVEHDIGIFFSKKRPYIIGVFVTDHTNTEEAKSFIGKLSKIVYDHFSKEA